MREIWFRGKDIDTGEWHYGDLLQYRALPVIFDKDREQHECDAQTVGQLWKRITDACIPWFDGDILQSIGDPTFEVEIKFDEETGQFYTDYDEYDSPENCPELWVKTSRTIHDKL